MSEQHKARAAVSAASDDIFLIVPASGQAGFVLTPSVAELVLRTYLNNLTASVRRGACSGTQECKAVDSTLECLAGMCVVPTAHYHEALSSSLDSNGASYLLFESRLSAANADPLWTEPLYVFLQCSGLLCGDTWRPANCHDLWHSFVFLARFPSAGAKLVSSPSRRVTRQLIGGCSLRVS